MKVVTAWLNNTDARCQLAQRRMLRSVLDCGFEPVIVNGTPRPLLTDMLKLARSLSPDGGHFMWLNSDCEIVTLPPVMDSHVIGLHRVETFDESVCLGVDGYIFPCHVWDKIYAPDLPAMYVGGTHVDWWLTRLAQKHGFYLASTALRHPTHAKSAASAGIDSYGGRNLTAFYAWAERNQISTDYEQ